VILPGVIFRTAASIARISDEAVPAMRNNYTQAEMPGLTGTLGIVAKPVENDSRMMRYISKNILR